MKKFIMATLVAAAAALTYYLAPVALAQNQVDVYMFVSETCPHCKHLEKDLNEYADGKSYLKLTYLEVTQNSDNRQLMQQVTSQLRVDGSGVPLTIVGNQYTIGYSSSLKERIVGQIEACAKQACTNVVKSIENGDQDQLTADDKAQSIPDDAPAANTKINLPAFGEIDVAKFSLPALTVIIGLLDGFNPCAMWALLFIISLLIGLKDRRKMWAYGLAFILTSAVVYLLFMLAWLKVFTFIGLVTPVRIIIGGLAIGIGIYYLKQYFDKNNVCKVSSNPKRTEWFEEMKKSILTNNFLLGLAGVIILALAVNLVELACSAGLPAIYTAVLSSAELSPLTYFGYLLLYVLFFMLDDLIVFGLAMKTMQVVGIDGKFSKASRLIGGLLMFILGLLLIFFPEVIMLG